MSANASLKPITLYGKHGPNPPKVRMLLEELNLPYELIDTQFPDLKKPDFLAINPNGRMPAIHDPNANLTLWESGAIIEYLLEKYDTAHTLSFPAGSNESQLARQWLFFQVSGQGPYYGQAMWFTKFHSEQIASAQDRYYREIERVTSVLNTHLEKQDKGADGPWLVGGKYSYADLAFVPWQYIGEAALKGKFDLGPYTEVKGWMERLLEKKGIKKVVDEFPAMG